jgi:hypothetical protein
MGDKFKVGDRVRVAQAGPGALRGMVGTVSSTDASPWDWEVLLDRPGSPLRAPLDEDEIEPVTPPRVEPDQCVDCLSPGCRVCNPWPYEEQDDRR